MKPDGSERACEQLREELRDGRREFLKASAAGVTALALPSMLSACATLPFRGGHTLNFRNDFGVLNYAFALETLEAEFYTRAVAEPPRDLRPGELAVLRDIRDHEVEHRIFFERALGPFAMGDPEVDLSSIDFASREGVLSAAQNFEDLGVAAYNGAGRRLKLAEFLTIAGKIVSVEARHAAVLRDLRQPGSRAFAGDDVVDARGMDRALPPAAVLEQARPFFRTQFRVLGL